MDETRDLTTATRSELLALITAQQQTIATLEGRLGELERRLGSSGGKGMPGTKPAAATRSTATGKARTRRARGYTRQRSLTPTQHVVHAADACPDCTTPLSGGWVARRREVIELPAAPVQVTHHLVLTRRCPACRGTVTTPLDLGDRVVGKQRLGVGLQSLIVTLREVGRWPVAQIQWYLQTLHGLRLSRGAIVAACHRVANAGQLALCQIRDAIRASPVVHLDETGWRQNGVNGYVWTASTPTERFFVRGSRAGAMVEAILGEATDGVRCCDGYAGYHHYAGRKQRWWAHVLRDVHDLRVAYPDDRRLRRWAGRIKRLYADAVAFEHADARVRSRAQRRFEQRLARLCTPFTTDATAVQAKLCRSLLRHLPERFVFVAEPAVPPDNNAAERALRPLVTARKISGGTRSAQGTATRMVLASLFGTARLRRLDPLLSSASVLSTGQL